MEEEDDEFDHLSINHSFIIPLPFYADTNSMNFNFL